jgi:zinc transport system substrate-binding protein
MNRKKWVATLIFVLANIVLVACTTNDSAEPSEEAEISVVTSFFPVYEFTQAIAGERANVSLMVTDGADPHSYEPSAQNVVAVNEADVFVYSSEEMEFWVGNLLNSVENDDLIVARTADGLETEGHYEAPGAQSTQEGEETSPLLEDSAFDIDVIGVAGHYHTGDVVTLRAQYEEAAEWKWFVQYEGEEWQQVEELTDDRFEYEATGEDFYVQAVALNEEGTEVAQSEPAHIHIDDHDEADPHIWLDPVLAQDQVEIIRDALIEADPEGEEVYTENAAAFNEELQTLHEEFEEAFSEADNRVFVVQHEAFGYLASRYNLEQLAIGGLSTEVEPSPSRLAEIGGLVEEYDVPVIYYQSGANSSVAQTVANETGTETAVLHDLETLSEELQAEDLGYLDAMRENLESLKVSIH